MIVPIKFLIALSSKPCVPHNYRSAGWNFESQLVCRFRTLEDSEVSAMVVRYTGSVAPSRFAYSRECVNSEVKLILSESVVKVDHTEKTAHQSSTSLSTGSFM